MRSRSTVTGLTRFVVVATLAIVLTGPVAAMADTILPVAEPVVCETAPIDDLRYAVVAADISDDVPIPDPIPYETPVGTVTGALVIDEVKTVLGQVVACVNEGRNAAFLSLFTDAFLERHVGDFGDRPDDSGATPIPDDMRLSLVRHADVTVLADGRVAALVVFDQSEREAPELTSLMTFAGPAGRLLIDEWQPVTLPEAETPVPCGVTPDTAPGCLPPTSTPVAVAWELVSGPGYTGVIAPLERAPIFRTGYGDMALGWWLPTAEEIAALEAALPNHLRTFSDERTIALADKVGTYKRQYAGLVIDGRALIFVNALCFDPTDGGWTSGPIFVDDGGDCFFQLYYEPSTGGFRELSINGEG